LVAVLAVKIFLGLQDGQVELRDVLGADLGVTLGQVVHQHPATLEANQASVALVDEAVVLARHHLGDGGLVNIDSTSCEHEVVPLVSAGVQPLHVLAQLVLALELAAAGLAHELAVVRVPQHVQPKLVHAREHLASEGGDSDPVGVERPDVFFQQDEVLEDLGTLFAGEPPTLVRVRDLGVLSQPGPRREVCPADRTVEVLPVAVCLHVARHRRVGHHTLGAHGALWEGRQRIMGYVHAEKKHL
ncbi:hypothetical protein EGW08_014666, partial [Elysia chlorotica]